MNYSDNNNECQLSIDDFLKNEKEIKINYLKIPCNLEGFVNTSTETKDINNHNTYCFNGYIELTDDEIICQSCGNKMHKHDSHNISIKHIPIGGNYSFLGSRLIHDDEKSHNDL